MLLDFSRYHKIDDDSNFLSNIVSILKLDNL